MAIRRKLTLINGMIDTEDRVCTYRATNSFEIGCFPTPLGVPPLPFPNDDDDWDNFDHAE